MYVPIIKNDKNSIENFVYKQKTARILFKKDITTKMSIETKTLKSL